MNCAVLLFLILTTYCSCIEIKTRLGNVIGAERKSRDGKIYHAFTSIPYAKPPLGNLRFKNPVKIESWKETLDGTKELPKCIQIPSFLPKLRNKVLGQEDCLYLNVYTPDVAPAKKLPVLIYVHGGGFRCGDVGTADSADYFMDENVIMVNFHYRLAALGFLSTENSIIPGNFGLKDQAMAVKWVHENIDSFGGDPNKITVFGESAGGISTHYLGMSPLTKDLLYGVISESGTSNKYWGFSPPGASRAIAMKAAEMLGCEKSTDQELLACLQKTDVTKLVNVELKFIFWDFDPAVVFRPVQEPQAEGAFMPFDPLKTETTFPWLMGTVSDEGLLKTASLLTQDDSVTEEFIKNIDEYLPRILFLNNSHSSVKKSAEIIKGKYFPEPISVKSAQKGLGDIYGDALFYYPLCEAVIRHKGPLYQYLFDYRGANSLADKWAEMDLGVSHADELLLLFNWKEVFTKFKAGDEQVSRRLVKMWADFARKLNPTPDGDPAWPEGSSTGEYLHITERFTVKKNLKKDVLTWWSNLPIYKTSQKNVKIEL